MDVDVMTKKKIAKGPSRRATSVKPLKSVEPARAAADTNEVGNGTLTLDKLERHLWGAADILRGSIDSGDYKHYIFGLLFYKRLSDVWEEEYELLLEELGDEEEALDPKEHRFQIPRGHFWNDVRKKSHNIGEALTLAFNAIEDANIALRQIFQDIDFNNKERFPDATLEKLLHHFERHRLRKVDVEPDVLGQAYEYLIAQFADDAGKKGGEFYTPRQVVKLMVECLRPEEGMSIYDPACGSGGMLLEAVHFMERIELDARSLSLFGQEKNLNTWAICRMNMFLHDIADAKIERGDTLLDPKHSDGGAKKRLKTFDVVLANPPFSLSPWGHDVWSKGDPWGRDVFGCPPAGYGDFAFVEHMIASLNEGGRMAVVVPHGVLFRPGAEGTIRQGIVEADLVEAVIGLGSNLFYGASIPAAILIINKKKPAARKNKVVLVNGSEELVAGKAQNTLSDDNVARMAKAVLAFKSEDRFAKVVSIKELEENDYNLNLTRYVPLKSEDAALDVGAEVKKLMALYAERNEAEARLNAFLRELGYGI
jgi:type I restriction enzyme M protein